MRRTPPAPADNLGAAPFPQPRVEKLSVHLYGGRASRWHCLWDCYGISLCLCSERTCVRVLGECTDLCKSVCWCVCVSFPVPLLFRFRLRYIERGPLPRPNPVSQNGESSLQSEDVQEAGVPAPRPPHHSPSVTCAAAPTLAGFRLQRAYFLAGRELWISSPLRAPGSALPAPARPDLEEWGGAAEAAPPHPERGVVCPAPPTTNLVPTQKKSDPVPSPKEA